MNEAYNIEIIEEKAIVSAKLSTRKLFFILKKDEVMNRDIDFLLMGAKYYSSFDDAKANL